MLPWRVAEVCAQSESTEIRAPVRVFRESDKKCAPHHIVTAFGMPHAALVKAHKPKYEAAKCVDNPRICTPCSLKTNRIDSIRNVRFIVMEGMDENLTQYS